ncbi:MAG: DUF4876 domain-containing protein, partial [Bacteroidales bacterium]
MKKQFLFYIRICLFLFLAAACRHDEENGSPFLHPISMHLTYDKLGTTIPYSDSPVITLVNNTEQLTSIFTSDAWGNTELKDLLPGEYTVTVSCRISASEMSEITQNPEAKEGSLGGFLNNLRLRQGEENAIQQIQLMVSADNPVIIKEIYYAGSRTPSGMTYRNDGFYSIHNNSPDDIYLNNFYIGAVENFGGLGVSGPLWPDEIPGNYKHVYVMTLWKIVAGTERRVLRSGEDAVIAVMGAPHNKNADYNPASPVDLSGADFEAYVQNTGNTYPDFQAPNMELVFWPAYSYLWRLGVFGQGIVLIQATEEEAAVFETVTLPESFQDPFEDEEYWLCKKIPIRYVVDAVDLIQNRNTTNTKRFPPLLDAGA